MLNHRQNRLVDRRYFVNTNRMIGFTVKKAFFDLWDNFLPAVLANLGFAVVALVPLTLPFEVAPRDIAMAYALLVLGVLLLFLYIGAAAAFAERLVRYEPLQWSRVRTYFRNSWKTALALGLVNLVVWFLLMVGIPTYAAMDNLLGSAALALLLWTALLWLLVSQYVLPAALQLESPFFKATKKSLILVFDNTGFTIMVFLGSIIIIALSVFTAFLFPGIVGLLVWHQTAVRLRLAKYDYLAEHPEVPRHEIPWDALLEEEREMVGKRTLKGTIFPWKE